MSAKPPMNPIRQHRVIDVDGGHLLSLLKESND
jgi:hypothetical protein